MTICPECNENQPLWKYDPSRGFPRCFDCNKKKKEYISKSEDFDICKICNKERKNKNFTCCAKCKFTKLTGNQAFERLAIDNIQKIARKDPLALPKNIMSLIYEMVEEEPFEYTFKSDKWSTFLIFGIYKDDDGEYRVSRFNSQENKETGQYGIDIRYPDKMAKLWLDEVLKYMDISWGGPCAVYSFKSKNNTKACIRKCKELFDNKFEYHSDKSISRFARFADGVDFEGLEFINFKEIKTFQTYNYHDNRNNYKFYITNNKYQVRDRKDILEDNMDIHINMHTMDDSYMFIKMDNKMKLSYIRNNMDEKLDNAYKHFRQYNIVVFEMSVRNHPKNQDYDIESPYENIKMTMRRAPVGDMFYHNGYRTVFEIRLEYKDDYDLWIKRVRQMIKEVMEDLDNS